MDTFKLSCQSIKKILQVHYDTVFFKRYFNTERLLQPSYLLKLSELVHLHHTKCPFVSLKLVKCSVLLPKILVTLKMNFLDITLKDRVLHEI